MLDEAVVFSEIRSFKQLNCAVLKEHILIIWLKNTFKEHQRKVPDLFWDLRIKTGQEMHSR